MYRFVALSASMFLFTACSYKTVQISGHNGKAYEVPSDCVNTMVDPNDPDTVNCFNQKGEAVAVLHPMSAEEIEAYKRKLEWQRGLQILAVGMNALAAGYNSAPVYQSTDAEQMQQALRSISYKRKKPAAVPMHHESTGYQSYSGKRYQYDLSRPMDQVRYSTDTAAQMRDMRKHPSSQLYDYMDAGRGQVGGGVME